jgi:hypothetical protein
VDRACPLRFDPTPSSGIVHAHIPRASTSQVFCTAVNADHMDFCSGINVTTMHADIDGGHVCDLFSRTVAPVRPQGHVHGHMNQILLPIPPPRAATTTRWDPCTEADIAGRRCLYVCPICCLRMIATGRNVAWPLWDTATTSSWPNVNLPTDWHLGARRVSVLRKHICRWWGLSLPPAMSGPHVRLEHLRMRHIPGVGVQPAVPRHLLGRSQKKFCTTRKTVRRKRSSRPSATTS